MYESSRKVDRLVPYVRSYLLGIAGGIALCMIFGEVPLALKLALVVIIAADLAAITTAALYQLLEKTGDK